MIHLKIACVSLSESLKKSSNNDLGRKSPDENIGVIEQWRDFHIQYLRRVFLLLCSFFLSHNS